MLVPEGITKILASRLLVPNCVTMNSTGLLQVSDGPT